VPFGPPIPDWATEDALDRHVLREFEALGERRSSEVARRLVAAYVAADEGDLATALSHVAVVRVVGARLAAAREAAGIIAYRCGDYELASKDLKAARRISGNVDTLPVMADCERGLGRPERALELAASAEASGLDLEGRVEMLLVAAGARQDLGQPEAAVLTLQVPELTASHTQDWHYRLVAGYAEALELAGRLEEAEQWRATAARHPAAPDPLDDLPDGAVAYDRDGLAQDDPDAYDAAAGVGDFVDLGPDDEDRDSRERSDRPGRG
jgi:tetratricopeptide (TPR) repeat protein